MKTLLLTTAILALLPVQAAARTGPVQIYGRLNLALEAVHHDGDSVQARRHTIRASNYRSVLGLRGSEALSGDLRLIYQIEGAVSPDTGAGALASRDTRVGLEGRWGTLFGGNWSTPYNSATSSLDPFYPSTAGYMSVMGNGSASSSDNVIDTTSFDRRQQNSLHYWTPAWRGVSLRLAHGFNEESPQGGARPSLGSAALLVENGNLYAALAHERHHEYQGPGRNDQGTKLAAAYRFGPTRLAFIAEKLRYQSASGTLRRSSYYAALTQQIGAHGIRLAVAKAQDGTGSASGRLGFIASGPATGALHYTLGYDYAISKRTTLFAFHTGLRNDDRAVYDFAINGLDAAAGSTLSGTAVGIRHAF